MSATNQKRWSWATVVDVRDEAKGVRAITLRYESLVPRPDPGSHIDVRVPIRERIDTRSYSVVRRSDRHPATLTIAVQLADRSRGGSAYMHTLETGARLAITQPLNNFSYAGSRRPVRLLAGGIGITALFAMARQAAMENADYTLTYVGREPARLAFLEELETLHGHRFQDHLDDRDGRFDVEAWVSACPADAMAYMCGPLRLMEAVRASWATQGRDSRDLRFETFGASGRHPSQSFTVKLPTQGVEIEVPADQSILDTLESAGFDMMYDCRKGECGLCQVKVLDQRGGLDHRDVFFSAEQHTEGRLLCTCVTRAFGEGASVTLELP
ncbi:2Fe-2S iron-sulfur cluster-binding protein [Nocardioides panzhihuensis]|uniref:Vanillate O-demethylase ferredoxin subunit n=1 Tax=Nocardioides panzhihuensis TaxID=860243 RepID=A0A7Z0DNT6_9ACTN|nr:vanillate O-demethylase ferredoxin subunit [Nocardioides panzhihuensis]